jgi:hypothetical protein
MSCWGRKEPKPWQKVLVDPKTGYRDWMKNVQDSRVCDLPLLLCSHNSGCAKMYTGRNPAWFWSLTQELSIRDQLHWGVRMFDFRLCDNNSSDPGEIYISHTITTKLRFSTVIEEFKQFLDANPSEVIFCWIRKDNPASRGIRKLLNREKVAEAITQSQIELAGYDPELAFAQTVGKLAGKMVLICGEDMFQPHEIHAIEVKNPKMRAKMKFPQYDIASKAWSPAPLGYPKVAYNSKKAPESSFLDIWTSGSVRRAKHSISNHLQKNNKERANGHNLSGISLDASFPHRPPSRLGPKMNDWFFDLLFNGEWPHASNWLGICELDYITPESASFLMNLYYGPDSHFMTSKQQFSAECGPKDGCKLMDPSKLYAHGALSGQLTRSTTPACSENGDSDSDFESNSILLSSFVI